MKKTIVLGFLACIFSLNLSAQDTLSISKLKKLTSNFMSFATIFPQEKAYVHFDNSCYYLGETIWFKAYVVTPERNGQTELSKTLYVELIAPEGNVIATKKLKIEKGQCHGEFELKKINFGGFFEVRAYTRNMLNFDKSIVFSRVLPIFDKPKTDGEYGKVITERSTSQRIPTLRKASVQKEDLSISFFPEGGSLTTGLNSKVAFKAVGNNGEHLFISGNIYDEKGTVITEIETQHQGMGLFEITPTVGKCFAKVNYQNKDFSFELPVANPSGYTLSVDNSGEDNITIEINSSQISQESVGLAISCRGKVYGTDMVQFDKEKSLLLNFPKRLLPTGIIQIDLFNTSGQVIAERLAFVNHQSQMNIDVKQDKANYNPHDKIKMDFQLTTHAGIPVETTFSVSVRDAASSPNNPLNESILTNLLLSSEIKGYIENPGYYFESNDKSRKRALDLLLMTQGWSRYVWKQMAGVIPFQAKHPIEKSLLIEGHVLSLFKKKPVENVEVSLFMPNDSLTQTGICKTEKDGIFNFALKDFFGQGNAQIQTKLNGKVKENYIPLERSFSPELKNYSFYETKYYDNLNELTNATIISEDSLETKKNMVSMDKKVQQLNEVIVKGKKKTDEVPANKVNIEYNVEKEMDKFEDTGEWQPETLAQLMRKLSPYYNDSPNRYKGKKLLFIYDNQTVSNSLDANASTSVTPLTSTAITSYDTPATGTTNNTPDQSAPEQTHNTEYSPNEIESILIVEDDATVSKLCVDHRITYESNIAFAIVKLYKNGGRHIDPFGVRKTKIDGYSYVKEFYSPNYNTTKLPDEKDYRRTLYWNPDVKTDMAGKVSISFYNNSTAKTLNVSAETVTEKGMIGSLNK